MWRFTRHPLVAVVDKFFAFFLTATPVLGQSDPTLPHDAVVTAHQARIDETYACDAVAEMVAAMLRPALFATALMAQE